MQKGKDLTVGIIGMGKMGLLHASIVNVLPGVRLSGMYDKNSTVVKFAKKAFTDVCVTDNLEKLADLHLDAVYVTTPIPIHFSLVRTIYAMGISRNLFVEKTLASDREQAKQLCHEAEAAGGVTMVGYMSRFAPTFQKARELLHGGAIGDATSFKAYAYASDFAGHKGRLVLDKGGATRDLGAHIIDQSLWFFGDLEVEPAITPKREDTRDGTSFNVRGTGGLAGEYDISWCREGYRLPEFGLVIHGSKGKLEVNADLIKLETGGADVQTWHRHNLSTDLPFFLGAPEYYWEDEHFIKVIMSGGTAQPDFNTASKVDSLIEQSERQVPL